ncbi:MAG: methionine adenosyltransferase [Bacilli bacterium]|nr:methionine adenosyltransferase [Bacilli bacterium]
MMKYFFTSEAVCEGHPDKVCDKISDYILDEALRQDKYSKMAVEATIKNNTVVIYGEATTRAKLDYKRLVREVIEDIGYMEEFDVIELVSEQSKEINNAVCGDEIMAGDQGIMFGYACKDTEELMPLPIVLANGLCYKLSQIRKSKKVDFLKSDGKSQVTVEYVDGKPKRVDTIVMAINHAESISQENLRKFAIEEVISKVISKEYLDEGTKILINQSGSFIIGGPISDSGTTGRKLISDSYGGMARIGGGAMSSKDPSKVDRSGAYYARYVAKNVVANDLANICEIQVSYVIGKSNPLSLFIDTKGTNKVAMDKIYKYVEDNFDFSVQNIIDELDLLRPIYYDVACYGHFGRKDLDLSWEMIKNIN